MPGLHTMRHFFDTATFVLRMREVAAALPDAEVYIPAGWYGSAHLFGLRGRAES